jgi:hypothetical protein
MQYEDGNNSRESGSSFHTRLTGPSVQETTMKTYITPSLASRGTILESTRARDVGTEDPKNTMFIEKLAPGSLGFQL